MKAVLESVGGDSCAALSAKTCPDALPLPLLDKIRHPASWPESLRRTPKSRIAAFRVAS